MATFRIHEDLEKENRVLAPIAPVGKAPAGLGLKVQATNNINQQQRSTFGVLNKLAVVNNGRELHAEKAVLKDPKLRIKPAVVPVVKGKSADENECQQPVQVNKVNLKQAEPFKAFQVYDDSKENNTDIQKKEPEAKREPLQELKNADLLETPMSVGESFSPMSVDKSVVLIEDTSIIAPRNDRERFFEVEEYQSDILKYLKEAEKRHRPKPAYMKKQPDINHSMRTILVDWLVEVCEEYRLQGETLCLAISYIDRFLSFMSVVRAKLQLVGTAAMFIAAKYEEIYPPDVGEFVYITDDTYTKTQVLRMEQLILKVLGFDLSVPTTLVFTTLYCVMNDVPDKVKYMCMYLCELSLLDADPYLTYLPSKISAGALALSRYSLDLPIWSRMLETNTGYRLEDLKDIILDLNKTHQKAESLAQQAIQEKFKGSKYLQVATVPATEISEEMFDNMCKSLAAAAASSEDQHEVSSTSNPQTVAVSHNDSMREMMSSLLFV
ncbi:G2/mitotic-specific cyclin-A-like [Uranotaenia lowii]|uniref:G2/mitotic-specific cyclin-A-like n=1 Tax=Uranotaenia lowii TaxID=190385 RepID=UPI002479C0F1|nr:G2/mitotic-specific cyclin-A-like [Uranotaenia lowii]XP_055598156.1 G2/mitotic-specific cyclin-A-like [Uranotaenia lowii]